MTDRITWVQWIPHDGLSHDERMALVSTGCHHDAHAELCGYLPLSRGRFAIVDIDLLEELSNFKWHVSGGYPARSTKGPQKTVHYLHRAILERRGVNIVGKTVDHINWNKFDARSANLRAISHADNLANGPPPKNNTSGFRGVRLHKRWGWQAYMGVARKQKHLGWFKTAEEASAAYENARAERFRKYELVEVPAPEEEADR